MSDRYIVSGSSIFSPSLNAVAGATGVTITSQLSNARSKSRRISVRTFCRLQVVRVVVTGREREGSQHDAAFHLGAETLRARGFVQLDIVVGGTRRP